MICLLLDLRGVFTREVAISQIRSVEVLTGLTFVWYWLKLGVAVWYKCWYSCVQLILSEFISRDSEVRVIALISVHS